MRKFSPLILSSINRIIGPIVTFSNNVVSEHRRVSTTKHPASTIMFGIVASNGEKMLSIWLELDYRLTSVEELSHGLGTKVVPCTKKIIKKSDYVFQQGRWHTRHRLCQTGLLQNPVY